MSTSLVVPVYDRRAETAGEVLVRSAVPDLRRKSLGLETKERKPSSGRYARDVAITSEHIDSDGDIVRADGLDVDTRYRKNPVVLLQHGRGFEFPVIGGNAVLERGTVDGKPGWIAKEWLFGDTVLGREINGLWNDLILRTTSIGFRPTTWHPIDADGERLDTTNPREMEEMTGFEFSASVLHEFSVVAIPANPHASRELDGLLSMKAAAFFDLGALRKACTKCAGGHEEPPLLADASVDLSEQPVEVGKAGPLVPGEAAALTVTEPESIARVAQILKTVSLERCLGCKGVNLYSREAGAFLEHRSKAGPRCGVTKLVGEPCGPTVKTIADGIRERTRDETRLANDAIPGDALALIEALTAVGDMKALAGWAGPVVKEIGELISKAGRVLSAETRRTIETQLANIESGIEAATMAIEAMRGAARGLKDFLVAADREDEPTPSDEAKASPAGGPPSVDDQLSAPDVQAALERLVAAVG